MRKTTSLVRPRLLLLAATVSLMLAAACTTPQQTDSTIQIINTIAPIIADLLKGVGLDAKGDAAVLAADAQMQADFGPNYIAMGKSSTAASAVNSNAWGDWAMRVAVARGRQSTAPN